MSADGGSLLIEHYDSSSHYAADFCCGVESLDRWLKRYAGQGERRDASRTFVAIDPDRAVRGYYSLLVGQVDHAESTETVRRGLSPHFPIPVAVLARLAVDQRSRGEGLGARLLADALGRVSRAADDVAVRAVLVHALDEGAAGFYRHFGFEPLTTEPLTLMVTLAELRAAGYTVSD